MVSFSVSNSYVAIIGDIVDSKKISYRKEVQSKLKNLLVNINSKYQEDIASKFMITLGDEFQGLLQNRNNILEIISEIEMEMTPVELRFGVGIGKINTEINFENSSEIDGSAYHRARKMIREIENEKFQYAKRYSNIMIASEESNIESDKLLNSVLSLCAALKSKWTTRQQEIIYAYFSNGENQHKAARSLGVSQPSVHRALDNARFYSYKSAIETASSFLNQEKEKDDD